MGMLALGAVAALVAAVAPAAQADEPGASLAYQAEAGAWPVDGRGASWSTPANEVMVWEFDGVVKVDGQNSTGSDYLRVELTGPGGTPLEAGAYTGVRNRHRHPEGPGIEVVSNGFGCGDDYAEFTITSLARDPADGALTALDVEVTHRCGSPTAPALTATAHFRR
ncbi:hypothetical protein [Actinokineospora iranica]|uniref:Uncharacterized protein n=1 Tax=Actinokineospora iranica TaxID=1271860 RepID=A0A1G6Z1F8_9PSEU|nr:hypothetical protein [Actinokineospora iranica]SDD96450.1 hypothetical protein SAMN05216174_1254 [Actinokineospora iranica]